MSARAGALALLFGFALMLGAIQTLRVLDPPLPPADSAGRQP